LLKAKVETKPAPRRKPRPTLMATGGTVSIV
jgi:hypothetical protein